GDDYVRMATSGQTLVFKGLEGNDTVYGASSSDLLDGGTGDDSFLQVFFGSRIVGGDGYDTVSIYAGQSQVVEDITIDLTSGGLVGENWTGIENVSGTLGQGNDTVVVPRLVSFLDGGGGTDSITLDYSGSDPELGGVSRIEFRLHANGGYSDQRENVYLASGEVRGFRIEGFENFDITGSAGDDYVRMATSGQTLVFKGLEGNDTVFGGGCDRVHCSVQWGPIRF
ncbi:MAG: hypothetical protein KDA83_18715, partial [Planctomycetales bacterium]|nr:hypothetical protein [Planctomycetales bacterium]